MDSPATQRPDPSILLDTAKSLGEQIRAAAPQVERERRVPASLLDALKRAGIFRMSLPEAFGGYEMDALTVVRVIEEVSRHDGSTGWIVMIGATSNHVSAFLPRKIAEEIFANEPDIITGGLLFPPIGRAVQVEGGYRITGHWPFGSGCEHCSWLFGPCTVFEGDKPKMNEQGEPEARLVLFPASAVTIHDTWHVSGLRGTGSHHYELQDLFVPTERTLQFRKDLPPQTGGALYRLPMLGLIPPYMAAVALGVARGSIDAFVEYARNKSTRDGPLVERSLIKSRVAEAEAIVRSARAFVFDVTKEVWRKAQSALEITPHDVTLLRLSGAHAAHTCAHAVDLMYTAGGAASLYESSALQRHLRDINAVKQHGLMGFGIYEEVGKSLLEQQEQVLLDDTSVAQS